jgi:predicted PurR-regulated permease PerM
MRGYEPPASPLDAPAPISPAVPQRTNGLAVVSLSMGIIWYFWIGSILALIFGYIAKRQIDALQGQQKGRGFAVAGIVLGWVGIGILALVVIAVMVSRSISPRS